MCIHTTHPKFFSVWYSNMASLLQEVCHDALREDFPLVLFCIFSDSISVLLLELQFEMAAKKEGTI